MGGETGCSPHVKKRTSGPVLPRRERPLDRNLTPLFGRVKRTTIEKVRNVRAVHPGTWIVIGWPARADSISAALPPVIATAMFSYASS